MDSLKKIFIYVRDFCQQNRNKNKNLIYALSVHVTEYFSKLLRFLNAVGKFPKNYL